MNKRDYYSPYKVAYHNDKIEQLRKGEMIVPLFAQIDLTNICNLNCSFCSYKIGNYKSNVMKDFKKQDKIDKKILFRILEEMKQSGVKALEWTGGGEPTAHPDWKEIVRKAKELGYEQSLVTNGTLLDDEGIELIQDFEWVRFSIDASNSETYNIIKKRDVFDIAISNLKKLIKVKESKNIVGVSFIVCRENYKEIYDSMKLAKKLGCNNVRYSLAYTPIKEKMFEGIWDEIVNQIGLVKKEETEDFKVFSFSNRINEISQKVKCGSCYFHEFVVALGANGIIYPCCLLNYNPKFNLGDLTKHSFRDIWFGEKRKKFTKMVRNGCPYSCWMTDKNKFITSLVQEDPPHVNFI